jgi:hypothetical protein
MARRSGDRNEKFRILVLGADCATVVFTPAQINGQTHNLSLISNVEPGKRYNLIAQRTYPKTNNPAKKFYPAIW